MEHEQKLQGKVALVTGGSRGIGRSIVETFARHGASVIINCCHAEQEANQLARTLECTYHVRAHVFQADVSDSRQVGTMMNQVEAQFDTLDILVNNAGVLLRNTFHNISEEQWDRTLAVNVKGAFLCAQAASDMMLRRKGGTIVSIASIRGITGGGSFLPYDVSKAGIITLTKSLAKELAPSIRVNCIAPGYVETDNLRQKPVEEIQAFEKTVPLKRLGMPEDIASAALFLVSADAAYITGATLVVSGGIVMH